MLSACAKSIVMTACVFAISRSRVAIIFVTSVARSTSVSCASLFFPGVQYRVQVVHYAVQFACSLNQLGIDLIFLFGCVFKHPKNLPKPKYSGDRSAEVVCSDEG